VFLKTPVGFPTKVSLLEDPLIEYLPTSPWLLLGDNSVRPIWQSMGLPEPPVSIWIETSEATKRMESILPFLEHWANNNIQRKHILVVVGGGVMTDMGGLAASLYMRGIPWHSWPTTIIGQIDAGIGGKTGVNLDSGKNLAGAFHCPEQTVIVAKFLASLPHRHQKSGKWELIKMALIAGDINWAESLLDCQNPSSTDMKRAIAQKIEIVHQDFRENGKRRMLNLGHTFGHALEAASDFSLLHGEAVGLGLLAACLLSERNNIGIFPPSLIKKISVNLAHLSTNVPTWEKCVSFMSRDKKNEKRGEVNFIIPAPCSAPIQKKISTKSLMPIYAKLLDTLRLN